MKEKISRREFLRKTGEGAAVLGAAGVVASCAPRKAAEAISGDDATDILENGSMELRANNGNGDKVSLLGYGCMRFSMKKGPDGKDIVDQDNVNALIDYALAHGVNYFDTSPVYLQGMSEEAVGVALSRHPRNEYFIATKMSNFGSNDRDVAMNLYEDSFRCLRTDYIDYYLLHSLGRGGADAFKARFEDNGIMPFLLEERRKGKIRQLGLSFHGNQEQFDQMMQLHEKYHWDFIQIQMNYFDWKHADGVRNVNADYLYEKLDSMEIPIVVMEPLQGGRLAQPADGILNLLKERDPKASAASWAFRFVGSHPRILTILSGMVYQEHLEDNLRTFMDFKPLTPEEEDFLGIELAGIMADYPLINCNDCKYCMPCPYGIDIPGIFQHYNKRVNEGAVPQSVEQENYRKLRRAYLVSYDRAIPTLRQASHCTHCKQCLLKCPQSIAIPRELTRIDRYIEKLRTDTL